MQISSMRKIDGGNYIHIQLEHYYVKEVLYITTIIKKDFNVPHQVADKILVINVKVVIISLY